MNRWTRGSGLSYYSALACIIQWRAADLHPSMLMWWHFVHWIKGRQGGNPQVSYLWNFKLFYTKRKKKCPGKCVGVDMLLLYDLLWSAIWFFFLFFKCKDSETGAYKIHKYTTKEDLNLILLDKNSVLSRGNGDKRLLCSVKCHYCHQQCQNSLEKLMGPFNLWHTTL